MPAFERVSIIIPHKDQPASLDALLDSIRAHAPSGLSLEILVVDDGSRESIEAICKKHDTCLVHAAGGRGPAHARNQGAAAASSEWLLFLDSDVEIPRGFFESIIDTLQERPDVDGLSFVNQPFRQGDPLVRNYGAVLEHFWYRDLFEPGQDLATIHAFTTRHGLIRKTLFETLGGFDTTFRANAHEDYDFGKRLSCNHVTLIRRNPLPYHRYPDSLRHLVRNYWVRVTLFIPYYLNHRPLLEETHASRKEGMLRVAGFAGLICLMLALAPFPFARLWCSLAAFFLACYLLGVLRFLLWARRASGSGCFMLLSLGIHYVTTVVIATGALWALCAYCLRPRRHVLKSPIR